jgi:predicted outer membrane repeat protein
MAVAGGAGIYCCLAESFRISNCLVSGNNGSSKSAIECLGNNSNEITNCTIVGNCARWESTTRPGGIYLGDYIRRLSSEPCGYASVQNCIVRDNRGSPYYPGDDKDNFVVYCDSSEVLYNNIEGGWDGLGNNIDIDPMFAEAGYWDPNGTPEDIVDDFWVEGDYHLMWDSPCVDGGSPYFQCEPDATDVEGNLRILDGDNDGDAIVDMGAYERYPHDEPVLIVSKDQMSFACMVGGAEVKEDSFEIRNQGSVTLEWQITEDCAWLEVNPNSGSLASGSDEVVVSVDSSGLGLGVVNCQLEVTAAGAVNSPQEVNVSLAVVEYLLVPYEYPTIQAAVDAASDGDVVIVSDGVFSGEGNRDVDFLGKAITVRSENGPEGCVIDCQGSETEPHRGFLFGSGEGPESRLDGFTVINGCKMRGGAVNCRDYSNPTIVNCVFINNNAIQYAGALWCRLSSPTVVNCTFSNNHSVDWGGAVCCYEDDSPTFENCIFEDNTSDSSGGSMYCQQGNASLNGCTFSNNSSSSSGGGIFSDNDNLTLSGCSFLGNSAMSGGGIRFRSEGILSLGNCFFAGNYAEYYGGAINAVSNYEDLKVYINNCTFSGNDAGIGSAAFFDATKMIIANSIIWANADEPLGPVTQEIEIYYCNVQDYMGDEYYRQAYGNKDIDPNFVDTSSADAADWDLHLMPFSPCRDAGQTAYVIPDDFDIDGEPRVMGGRVDIGADEVGAKQADFTRDGVVDVRDFSVLGGSWGAEKGEVNWYVLCDLWEDDVIDVGDLAAFVDEWMWVREE